MDNKAKRFFLQISKAKTEALLFLAHFTTKSREIQVNINFSWLHDLLCLRLFWPGQTHLLRDLLYWASSGGESNCKQLATARLCIIFDVLWSMCHIRICELLIYPLRLHLLDNIYCWVWWSLGCQWTHSPWWPRACLQLMVPSVVLLLLLLLTTAAATWQVNLPDNKGGRGGRGGC